MTTLGATWRCLPPHLADSLAGITLGARRPMGGAHQGLHRSTRHGASVEFAEYRPYVPGDPPARIDWPAYARTDRYLVRRFEEETSLQAAILLDCSQSLAWRGAAAAPTKLGYACSLAAACLFVLTAQGDRAQVTTFSDRPLARLAGTGSAPALAPQLAALDALEPAGAGDIAAALLAIAPQLPRRALVILISDFLQAPATVANSLVQLTRAGHDVRLLHVIDRAELTLRERGLVEVEDLETGERIEADLAELAEGYAHAVTDHLEEIKRIAHAHGSAYQLVDTSTPIARVLRSL